MQATECTPANPSTEDFDDSLWASLWLSGWDGWTEPFLNAEQVEQQAGAAGSPKARSGKRKARNSEGEANGCGTCGKILSSPNALRLHSKTHEGGRPFVCEECGSRFARKDHLRVHYRVHTGERPYSCTFCGNSFAHSGTLKSHIRTHTGEKPFACENCGVCFSDPSTLRMHRLKHAGVKSFICGDCGMAFASNGLLNKHKRVHPKESCAKKKRASQTHYEDEQLIPCNVCGRIFKSEHSLSCHMKVHVGGANSSGPHAHDDIELSGAEQRQVSKSDRRFDESTSDSETAMNETEVGCDESAELEKWKTKD